MSSQASWCSQCFHVFNVLSFEHAAFLEMLSRLPGYSVIQDGWITALNPSCHGSSHFCLYILQRSWASSDSQRYFHTVYWLLLCCGASMPLPLLWRERVWPFLAGLIQSSSCTRFLSTNRKCFFFVSKCWVVLGFNLKTHYRHSQDFFFHISSHGKVHSLKATVKMNVSQRKRYQALPKK